MLPFYSKSAIIWARIDQIGMISIFPHFNQEVSLYISKNQHLSKTPASQ